MVLAEHTLKIAAGEENSTAAAAAHQGRFFPEMAHGGGNFRNGGDAADAELAGGAIDTAASRA